jgi:hypothetical protein
MHVACGANVVDRSAKLAATQFVHAYSQQQPLLGHLVNRGLTLPFWIVDKDIDFLLTQGHVDSAKELGVRFGNASWVLQLGFDEQVNITPLARIVGT